MYEIVLESTLKHYGLDAQQIETIMRDAARLQHYRAARPSRTSCGIWPSGSTRSASSPAARACLTPSSESSIRRRRRAPGAAPLVPHRTRQIWRLHARRPLGPPPEEAAGETRDTRLLAKRRRRSQSHPRLQPMLRLGLKLRLALRPPRLRRTRLGLKRRLALRPPRLRPMLQLRPRLGLKLPLALRPPRLRRTLLRWQRCPAARLRRAMRTSGPCQIAAGAARWSSQCRTRSFVVAPRGAAGRRRGRGLRRRPLRRPSRSRGRLAQATASSGAAAKIAWASAPAFAFEGGAAAESSEDS